MQTSVIFPLIIATMLWLSHAAALRAADDALVNRGGLYDLTTASRTNPVLASVDACGIEITATEFAAYIRSDVLEDKPRSGPMTLEEKRALLERLLDEHFLLWDGRRQKADESEGMTRMLKETLNMTLQETLIDREVASKATNGGDYERRLRELRDRLFDRTDIFVSNEACDDVKAAARQLQLIPEAKASTNHSATPPANAEPVTAELAARPLARSQLGTVTIADFLTAYAGISPSQRPNLEQRDAFIGVIKRVMQDALLIAEARARGYEQLPEVQRCVQLNRNVLTRLYAIDKITDSVVAKTKEPGHAGRVRAWYEAHLKDRYTVTTSDGVEHTVAFDEERESIENDFFDHLQEQARADRIRFLREGKAVRVNERALKEFVATPRLSDG